MKATGHGGEDPVYGIASPQAVRRGFVRYARWTRSDAQTWDRFPHTAADDGRFNQPISQFALCEDAS